MYGNDSPTEHGANLPDNKYIIALEFYFLKNNWVFYCFALSSLGIPSD